MISDQDIESAAKLLFEKSKLGYGPPLWHQVGRQTQARYHDRVLALLPNIEAATLAAARKRVEALEVDVQPGGETHNAREVAWHWAKGAEGMRLAALAAIGQDTGEGAENE